jgi:tetraacyldisaccharide 4'-kinase
MDGNRAAFPYPMNSVTLLRWLLAPLAPLYGLAVRARNRAFDERPWLTERAALPVLSVGNLSIGGTGKTPLTLHLAQALGEMGLPNVVLSRGYRGRRSTDPMAVGPGSNPGEVGDEPAMMAKRLGPNRVVVGRRRIAAARMAVALAPEARLLILDDGFQHRAIRRDIDILLLDGVRAVGNGRMLPLGYLREPMENARRAHALVVTRGGRANTGMIEAWWSRYGSGGPVFYVDFQICALRSSATSARLALPAEPGALFAFCALGHPQAFYADLLAAGLACLGTRSFRDHQGLAPRQVAKMAALAIRLGAVGLVCTEKDAIKLTDAHLKASPLPIWIAEQDIAGAQGLTDWVAGLLEKGGG